MDHASIKNIISYLIIASIFVTGQGWQGIGFDLYWYYPFYFLFVIYGILVYHRIDLRIFFVVTACIVYTLLTWDLSLSLVMKQVVNICFSIAVFYYFIVHESFDFTAIFRKYVAFAKLILILGFVQVLLFTIGAGHIFLTVFSFLKSYPVHERLQSISHEPSYIGFTFGPIVFIAVHNLLTKSNFFITRWWCILFIVGYILTQSSVAFAGLLLSLVLVYFKNFSVRKLQFALIAFGGMIASAPGNSPHRLSDIGESP